MGYAAIQKKLRSGKVVLLDGGIGTEVLRRTGRWVRNGIEDFPEVIQQIHRDYIDAGADVITANTFQIARHTFLNFFHDLDHMRAIGRPGLEHRAGELHGLAVGYAVAARRAADAEERVAIAGSISPLNHPYRSDLAPDPARAEEEHSETALSLQQQGVDLILVEAMNTLAEAKAAVRAARATGLPVWVSLIPDGRGRTLAGEPLTGAAELAELEPDAILVNCAPVDHIGRAFGALWESVELPTGAYALIGRYAPPSWKMDFFPRFDGCEETSPASYARSAREWADSGARIVGGCCGTTPAHISATADALSN